MRNDICIKCGGKGYNWHREHLLDRDTGAVKANLYRRGDDCPECEGTGHCGLQISLQTVAIAILAALVLSAFVIMPLIHLWLD